MHRLTATDTPMVRYTRTIFPSYAVWINHKKNRITRIGITQDVTIMMAVASIKLFKDSFTSSYIFVLLKKMLQLLFQ